MSKELKAYEQMVNVPIAELIKEMGSAVASANQELMASESAVRFTIPKAVAEVSIAINAQRSTELGAEGGVALGAFSLNASYKSSYGFSESASSKIMVEFQAMPNDVQAPEEGEGGEG